MLMRANGGEARVSPRTPAPAWTSQRLIQLAGQIVLQYRANVVTTVSASISTMGGTVVVSFEFVSFSVGIRQPAGLTKVDLPAHGPSMACGLREWWQRHHPH